MELTGEKVIPAPRQRVHDALHDAVILRQAIPGCQVLNRVGDRYEATVALKIGPMKGSFFGTIHVYDGDPPSSFSLRAWASGGLAGNAAGDAHVALASIDETTTNLAYHLKADVKGQLADLEGRPLDSAARTLVAEFFSRLETVLDTSRFVSTSAPTTDATGAPTGGWEPRRLPTADTLPDETAYSASQYTRAAAPATRTAAGVVPQQFETAAATNALGEPDRLAAEPATDLFGEPAYQPQTVPWDARIDALPAQPSVGRPSRTATAPEPERSGMTIWRWFLVLVGLVLIAALLTDSI